MLAELHPDQSPLAAELRAVTLDVRGHANGHLRPLQHHEDVVQDDGVLELERGQTREYLLESLPIRLERRQRLVRLGEDFRDGLELVAHRPREDGDGRALLRDGDHKRAGLLRDAFRSAMARTGLTRRDRRVRHELHVRVGELRELGIDDDRAVHLRELVEELRRKREIELHAARVQERKLPGISDHDQRALVRANDVIDRLPEVRTGSDLLQRPEELRIAAWILLGRRAREPEFALRSIPLRFGLHRVPPRSPFGACRPRGRPVCLMRRELRWARRLRRVRASCIPRAGARPASPVANGP